MIKKIGDLVIAEYQSSSEINNREIDQADLVSICGYYPGGIYTPSYVQWLANISHLHIPIDILRSSRAKKVLRRTLDKANQLGIKIQTQPLTEKLYNQYKEYHHKTLTVQPNKRYKSINLDETVLSYLKNTKSTWLILVTMAHNSWLGAMIFRIVSTKNTIRVSFSAKQHIADLRGGGIGSLLEYELIRFAIKNGITTIDHGINTNPFGLISKTHLFEFKAHWGFTAYPEKEWRTLFILKPRQIIDQEMLWLQIAKNKLYYTLATQKKVEEKYLHRYKTRLVTDVEQRRLNDISFQAKKSVNYLLQIS